MDELSVAIEEAEMMKASVHLVAYVDERYQQVSEKFMQALVPIENIIDSVLLLKKDEAAAPVTLLRDFNFMSLWLFTSVMDFS